MLRSGLSMSRDTRHHGRPPAAADLLHEARNREISGCMPEAAAGYRQAIQAAENAGEPRVLAEALRRLAVLRYHENEPDLAQEMCDRSYRVASDAGIALLAAEALNTLATLKLQAGLLSEAGSIYEQALELGGEHGALRARVEQNRGILANIHGDLDEARDRYQSSLDAFDAAGDKHGCAIAYHNLGMVSADCELWDEAENFYQQSRAIAEQCGDGYLQGLCLVNHAEVEVARQRYEDARRNAEAALALFDQLGARPAKVDAYRVIGMVYRDTARFALAESRLRSALELAQTGGSVLGEAEASRELAVLHQVTGRNQEALALLHQAHALFQQLDARVELVNIGGKVAALETTYMAVVQEWGESIETTDSYTHGHCERVARYAVAVARALNLSQEDQKTIRIGAYLHDLGKVRVPHEILNKPGPLTPQEFEVMQMHTVWGVEAVADIEFPWAIKPIIRWHHEKYDGSGYPDRLAGDEIPVSAQVIGIVDAYDAMTTTRAYRPAMSHDTAIGEIQRCRHWWRQDVVEAFMASVAVTAAQESQAA